MTTQAQEPEISHREKRINALIEQFKREHLIYHDPHMVARVKELLMESGKPAEVSEPKVDEKPADNGTVQ